MYFSEFKLRKFRFWKSQNTQKEGKFWNGAESVTLLHSVVTLYERRKKKFAVSFSIKIKKKKHCSILLILHVFISSYSSYLKAKSVISWYRLDMGNERVKRNYWTLAVEFRLKLSQDGKRGRRTYGLQTDKNKYAQRLSYLVFASQKRTTKEKNLLQPVIVMVTCWIVVKS